MNRSTILLTVLALTLFTVAILWQRSGIRSMQSEIQILEATLNPARSEATSLIEARNTTPVPPKPARQSVSEILELIPSQQEGSAMRFRGMPKGLRAMPKLLEALTSYTVDDLFAVIDQLDSMEASAEGNAATLKSLVSIVLTDAAPERVLKLAERKNDRQLRAMAFESLARIDPQRAREVLSHANWPRPESQRAKTALMSVLINTDVPQALSLMREDHADLDRDGGIEVGMIIGLVSDNEASRRDLWAAMEREEESVRDKFMPGLVVGEFFRDGFPALRQAFKQLALMDDSTKSALVKEVVQMGIEIMSVDPTGAYEWMRESVSAEQFHETFADAVGSWARKDFNAAGAWLGSQPSSPERDAAVSTFARTVVSIDPEAAAIWAASIDDELARTSALNATLGHWMRIDANAAKEWEERNGSDQE